MTPAKLHFGGLAVGTETSRTKLVTVFNLSRHGTPVVLSQIVPDGADFALDPGGTTCSGLLPARSRCVVAVTFTPSTMGPRSGTVAIYANAQNSPKVVNLAGKGVTTRPSP